MSMIPVLDTHVWIWWMLGDARLSQAERDALDGMSPRARPVLCDISLWEFVTLVAMGRVAIQGGVEEWLQVAASPATVRVQSITPGIVAAMNRLPSTFHRDPADRLIVATACFLNLPIATMDRKIRGSKLAPLWHV